MTRIMHPRIAFGLLALTLLAGVYWMDPSATAQAASPRASGPSARAADTRPAAGDQHERVISRLYDVRDLVAQVPDYPFPGMIAGSAGRSRRGKVRDISATAPAAGGGGGGGIGSGGAAAEDDRAEREARRAEAENQLVQARRGRNGGCHSVAQWSVDRHADG